MEVGAMNIVANKEVGYSDIYLKNKKDSHLVEEDSNLISKREIDLGKNNIKQEDISEEKLKDSVEKVNVFLKEHDSYVKYEQHEFFKNTFIVKIMDKENNNIIKEIPPKKILDMAAEMCKMAGILLDEKA
ncbi:MAG: flagellar protein FlaG [Clostridium sp.]